MIGTTRRRNKERDWDDSENGPSKYFAIAYHNIDEEIPEGSRRAVHFAHYSFILLTVALAERVPTFNTHHIHTHHFFFFFFLILLHISHHLLKTFLKENATFLT